MASGVVAHPLVEHLAQRVHLRASLVLVRHRRHGAGGRHRPTPEVVVASALDYCHKLDRELRQLGLRKEDRRLFVRSLVVNPHDPDAARLDAEASRRSAGGGSARRSSWCTTKSITMRGR